MLRRDHNEPESGTGSGMKLKELGTRVGGLDYGAVSEAIRRLEQQIKVDRILNALYTKLRDDLLEIET